MKQGEGVWGGQGAGGKNCGIFFNKGCWFGWWGGLLISVFTDVVLLKEKCPHTLANRGFPGRALQEVNTTGYGRCGHRSEVHLNNIRRYTANVSLRNANQMTGP